MSKSGRVRFTDLRRSYRLIHDARDVGLDPAAWSAVIAEGLRPLLGAKIVIVSQIEFGPCHSARHVEMGDRGWDSPGHRERWHRRSVAEPDTRGVETFHRFMAVMSGQTTRGRDQLVADAEWFRSYEYNEVFRPLGSGGLLVSFAPVGGRRAIFGTMSSRSPCDREFGLRERRLLHLFHLELARLLGTSILLDPALSLSGLSPRLRRTLDCLIEGDSEGQVALRLGLSRHTVHEYVTQLYRHFGVARRAELMARCARLQSPAKPGPPGGSRLEY